MSGEGPGHQRNIWNANDESSAAPAAHATEPAHFQDCNRFAQRLATDGKAHAEIVFRAEDLSRPHAALNQLLLNALGDAESFAHHAVFVDIENYR